SFSHKSPATSSIILTSNFCIFFMALSLLGLFRRARQNDRRRRGRFMSKAFCMIMLIGLGVAATPALAQGPKHNADKVRDQIERRDRDRARHDDRDDDR